MKKEIEITNGEINANIEALEARFRFLENRLINESNCYHYVKGKCDAYERVLIKHGLIDELKFDRLKLK